MGTSRDNALLQRSRAPRRPGDEIVHDDVTIWGGGGVGGFGMELYFMSPLLTLRILR